MEKVQLPELELFDIDAKVDTGAYTSTLHCHNIIEDEKNGILNFYLLDPKHPSYSKKQITFKLNSLKLYHLKAEGINEVSKAIE